MAMAAAWCSTVTAPSTRATAYSTGMDSVPRTAAAGMTATTAAAPRLVTTSTVFLSCRSMTAPAGSASTNVGSWAREVRRAIWPGVALRWRIASAGSATPCTAVPTRLALSPVRKARKDRWPRRVTLAANGVRAAGGVFTIGRPPSSALRTQSVRAWPSR